MAAFVEIADHLSDNSGVDDQDDECDISSDVNMDDIDSDGNVDGDEEIHPKNTAWANVMSKVIKTNVAGRTNFVLSKAKKEVHQTQKTVEKELEVVDDSGNVVISESPVVEEFVDKKKKRKEISEKQKKKYLWENMCRVKPDISERAQEKTLVRIATKGVVQLFNAVEMHQKNSKKNSKKNVNMSKVKGSFMDLLKGSVIKKEEAEDKTEESESKKAKWDVLKDNYMMGSSIKDWNDDDNEDGDVEEE